MKTKSSFNVSVSISKQGKHFVAYSFALDLSTIGKTEKEAQQNFQDAATVFFEELFESGNVDEVLAQLGWEKTKDQWTSPIPISQSIVEITIPASV